MKQKYTLRILVFRVVGFLARLSHVCRIHSSSSTRRRLAEFPNCSSLFAPTLTKSHERILNSAAGQRGDKKDVCRKTCFRLVYISGVSVFELLLAIAITLFLALISIPRLQVIFRNNEALTKVAELKAAIEFTRLSAIARGEMVMLCKSTDGKTCQTKGSWQFGQIIVSQNGQVLQVLPSLKNQYQLKWQGSLGVSDALQFLPTGDTNGEQGSFYFCSKQFPEVARAIIISENGRVYVSDKTAEGGIISCEEK